MNARWRAVVIWLATQQQPDGSFLAQTYADLQCQNGRSQPTIFPSALMLSCLQAVPGTVTICQKLADYIISNQQNGAWNYWDRSAEAIQSQPYPDDMDDTACAVAALSRQDAAWVTGAQLGVFARLLVAVEQQPGGPYNTWLADTGTTPQWADVDVAVNANIGYALSLHSVTLAALEQYIAEQLAAENLSSSFYVGETPVLYFLTRWYKRSASDQLYQKVMKAVERVSDSSLQQALLLSAGCHIGLDAELLKPLAAKLWAAATDHGWATEALYVDPVYDGQQHYGGSRALTTAFVLEALATYEQLQTTETSTHALRQPAVTKLDLGSPIIKRQYNKLARAIAVSPAGSQIIEPVGQLLLPKQQLPKHMEHHLNAASQHGWIAYTLQDDVLDGTAPAAQLTTANVALRRSVDSYLQALPEQVAMVHETFDVMDAANAWELTHARWPDTTKPVKTLPAYGNLHQLAERSWGHSLVARGLLLHVLPDAKHPAHGALQTYFKHFLIARQLNDDAHDWEADVQAGQLSAVVVQLLRDQLPYVFNPEIDIPLLREQFWTTVIVDISETIHGHLLKARRQLPALASHINTVTLESWLDDLQLATELALQGRSQTLDFITAYQQEHAT